MAHPGHRKTKPSGRRLSKANVMADLKAGVAKAGRVLTTPERFMQKHRTSIAMLAVGGPLAGARAAGWAAGKTGATALIKKAGSRAYTTPRNWPNIIQTGLKNRAGWSGGKAIREWNVPPTAGASMERWAGAMGRRPPGHVNLKPLVGQWKAGYSNIPKPWTGAAKQSGTTLKATIGKPVPASSRHTGQQQRSLELTKEALRLKPQVGKPVSPPNKPVGRPKLKRRPRL